MFLFLCSSNLTHSLWGIKSLTYYFPILNLTSFRELVHHYGQDTLAMTLWEQTIYRIKTLEATQMANSEDPLLTGYLPWFTFTSISHLYFAKTARASNPYHKTYLFRELSIYIRNWHLAPGWLTDQAFLTVKMPPQKKKTGLGFIPQDN